MIDSITPDTSLTWRKASASTIQGNCVELAPSDGGVAVRDSKDPGGPTLWFTREEIAAFLNGIKAGEFDDLVDLPAVDQS
jgi:hypothetical protein